MTATTSPQQGTPLFDTSYQEEYEGLGRNKAILWAILALAVVGLCLSGYLTWSTWSNTAVVGCSSGGGADCEEVLKSVWSKWLGIPVSLFGLLTYVGLLTATGLALSGEEKFSPTLLLTLGLLAAGSATWFIGLQVFQIGSFCLYCMGVHLCSLIICGLTVFHLWSSTANAGPAPMGNMFGAPGDAPTYDDDFSQSSNARPILASCLAACGLAVLMIGQFFFQPDTMQYVKVEDLIAENDAGNAEQVEEVAEESEPDDLQVETNQVEEPASSDDSDDIFAGDDDDIFAKEAEPEKVVTPPKKSRLTEPRFVKFGGLQEPIDVANVPILGSPEAEFVLLEMLDYTCPHCRNLHPSVEAAVERYGDQVAFVVFHVPLSKKCNPYVKRDHWSHKNACDYARLALSIFRLDRTKFAEFHNWVMGSKRPPAVAEARRFAMKLVGEEVLLDENLKAESLSSFAGNSDDLKKMNTGLPLIVTKDGLLKGVPKSENEFFDFLETVLGVTPVAEL